MTDRQRIADVIDSELEKLARGQATVARARQTLQAKATGIGTGR
ncbi:hypothetical protein [Streptomyces sp. NPDC002172]